MDVKYVCGGYCNNNPFKSDDREGRTVKRTERERWEDGEVSKKAKISKRKCKKAKANSTVMCVLKGH